MPCHYPFNQPKFKFPDTIIKEYRIDGVKADGTVETISVNDNHQRFVKHSVDWNVQEVRFIPVSTHGNEKFRLFSFEIN